LQAETTLDFRGTAKSLVVAGCWVVTGVVVGRGKIGRRLIECGVPIVVFDGCRNTTKCRQKLQKLMNLPGDIT
jgi:hypothetical protein